MSSTSDTTANNDRVIIFDTTLRDGEQSPGISLDQGEKVEIAEQLARLGVDVIEAGFPIASQGDFESVQAIAKSVRGPVICGLSRTALGDVDRCWEAIESAERRRIHVFIATSETHMKHKLRMTPEQVKAEAASGVARARSYTDDVEFSPEDASRSDFDFIVRGSADRCRQWRDNAEHSRHRWLRGSAGICRASGQCSQGRQGRLHHLNSLP